jgi:hypothetical protein
VGVLAEHDLSQLGGDGVHLEENFVLAPRQAGLKPASFLQ